MNGQPPNTGTRDPRHAARRVERKRGRIGPDDIRGRGRGRKDVDDLIEIALRHSKYVMTSAADDGSVTLVFRDDKKGTVAKLIAADRARGNSGGGAC